MNGIALVAGVLTLLAFGLHGFAGGREFRHVIPATATDKASEVRLQILNGWHWVSMDLLLAGTVFVLVGSTDVIPHEEWALAALSIYFFCTGAVWLAVTVVMSRARPILILRLGQWMLCFLLATLAHFAR